jgi:hypothetical protein
MAKSIIPKGCWVRFIALQRGGAEVGYDCGGPDGGGRGKFPLPRGEQGWSNYPKKWLKGVTAVNHRGAHVHGTGSSISFTLAPASASCRRSGREVDCTMRGDTSSPSLRGLKKRKRRRR